MADLDFKIYDKGHIIVTPIATVTFAMMDTSKTIDLLMYPTHKIGILKVIEMKVGYSEQNPTATISIKDANGNVVFSQGSISATGTRIVKPNVMVRNDYTILTTVSPEHGTPQGTDHEYRFFIEEIW